MTLVMVLLAAVLSTISLWNALSPRSEPAFLCLTPAEFTQTASPGPFMTLAYRLMNLVPPLGRVYMSRRQKLNISVQLYAFTRDGELRTELQKASSTNADGGRAWLLLGEDVKRLREGLRTNAGVAPVNVAGISTADGIRSTLRMGGNTPVPTGLTVDVFPKVGSGRVRLLVAAHYTEAAGSPSPGQALLRTNLDAACLARVPNGGGLVLASAVPESPTGTNLWLVVSVLEVDAKGNPVKPHARTSLH